VGVAPVQQVLAVEVEDVKVGEAEMSAGCDFLGAECQVELSLFTSPVRINRDASSG